MVPLVVLLAFAYFVAPLGAQVPVHQTAVAHIQAGRIGEAVKLLAAHLDKTPGDALGWNLLGIARAETGDTSGTDAAFERALRLQPTDPTFHENYGVALLRRNETERALEQLDAAIAGNAKSLRALSAAAFAAEGSGQTERSLAYLVRAKALAPDSVPLLTQFGRVCLQRDLGQDALEALRKAHGLAPDDNQVLYLLAAAHITVEKYADAFALLQTYLTRVQNNPTAYHSMGWLQVKLGRSAEARAPFERALELAPKFVAPLLELAELDIKDGETERARTRLDRVLALEPKSARGHLLAGDLARDAGDAAAARRAYETSIEIDPAQGPAHSRLGRVLMQLGDREGAAREQKLAAELNDKAKKERRRELRLAGVEGGSQ